MPYDLQLDVRELEEILFQANKNESEAMDR